MEDIGVVELFLQVVYSLAVWGEKRREAPVERQGAMGWVTEKCRTGRLYGKTMLKPPLFPKLLLWPFGPHVAG